MLGMLLSSLLSTIQLAGWLGTWEIVIIVVIVLLLFGGRKIPELMRGVGKGIKEFKDGIADDEPKDAEDKTEEDKKA